MINPHLLHIGGYCYLPQTSQWPDWPRKVYDTETYLEKSEGEALAGAVWDRRMENFGIHLQSWAKQRSTFAIGQVEAAEGVTVKETPSRRWSS